MRGYETSPVYTLKRAVDVFLVPVVALIPVYLYLTLVAPGDHPLAFTKPYLQLLILGSFVLELVLGFVLYRSSAEFVRDKWLDILLTIPLFTALKASKAVYAGLKVAKSGKLLKAGKATQKALKAVIKGEAFVDEHVDEDGAPDPDTDARPVDGSTE